MLSAGASLTGDSAIIQQLVLAVSPNNLSLGWGAGGILRFSNGTSGLSPLPGFAPRGYDVDDHVTWTADAATDVVTLGISGLSTHVFAPPPDGTFTQYKTFALTRNSLSSFTQYLDNSVITDMASGAVVPLPAAGWAGLALPGLLGVGRLSRRRSRD